MAKEQWKKCKDCGTITDADEKRCPNGRWLTDNPGHELEMVELTSEEVKKLWKEGKIWTKYIAKIDTILF